MNFSKKTKLNLFLFGIILNIILRFQVAPYEIGSDSFDMHIMVNSLSEFGYAKWFLHPLSLFGLYPASYSSAMHFVLSGISQSADIDIQHTIFIYTIFIGLLSMFTAYLMAGVIINNEIFKYITAFGFSLSPAILDLTTWTIPTRGLLMALAPLLIYMILKSSHKNMFIPLAFIMSILLFSTHNLFYFLVPPCLVGLTIFFFKRCKLESLLKKPIKFEPLIIIFAFFSMFSIPFFMGKFIESSRYFPIYIAYFRYTGILLIFAIGGLGYLIFKDKKSYGEYFLLLSTISITMFVFEQTYMKYFIPIFLIPLAGISLMNIANLSKKTKYIPSIVVIILVISLSFSAYFQFLHSYPETYYNSRHIEESTYSTGLWMKNHISNGSAVSNDAWLAIRLVAVSDTVRMVCPSVISNQIYGFININISEFNRYSLTDEQFYFSGYEGPDYGEYLWEDVLLMRKTYDLKYVVENRKGAGLIIWKHRIKSSPLVQFAYEKTHIYDSGNIYIWYLGNWQQEN